MMLIGCGIGTWLGIVEPINREWKSVEPLIARGGRVETVDSNVPKFLGSFFHNGKTSHIEAVFANKKNVSVHEIRALQCLPKLKRLYLERTGLTDEHLVEIGKLTSLERLSLWANHELTDDGLDSLKPLSKLQVIDITNNIGLSWRAIPALKKRVVEVRHATEGLGVEYRAGDWEDLELACIEPDLLILDDPDEKELVRVLTRFDPTSIYLKIKSSALSNQVLDLIVDGERLHQARIHCLDRFNGSAFDYTVKKCSSRLEQVCWGEIFFDGVPDFPLDHGVALVCSRRLGSQYNYRKILRFYGAAEDFRLSELPTLKNVKAISIGSRLCGPDPVFKIDDWLDIVKVCPKLTNLWIRSKVIETSKKMNLVCEARHLKKLDLGFPNTFDLPTGWFENLKCKSNLEEIRIRGTTLDVKQLAPICDYPKLVHANLFCPDLPTEISDAWTERESIESLRAAAKSLGVVLATSSKQE